MEKNILVLDDSPFMLRMVSDLLTSWNYAVTPVQDGRTACEKLRSGRYDLIVTDLNMPRMDGIEFAREVRALPGCRFLPIVMFSGEKNEERIARAKKEGVSTFLSKPLKEAQLKSILHITLNKRKAPRFPMKAEAVYGTDQGAEQKTTSCTFNVSLGGVFLETDQPLPPGSRLNLKFSLPDLAHPIQGQGRVAWVNSPVSASQEHPPGMGVEFLELENEHLLQRFFRGGKS